MATYRNGLAERARRAWDAAVAALEPARADLAAADEAIARAVAVVEELRVERKSALPDRRPTAAIDGFDRRILEGERELERQRDEREDVAAELRRRASERDEGSIPGFADGADCGAECAKPLPCAGSAARHRSSRTWELPAAADNSRFPIGGRLQRRGRRGENQDRGHKKRHNQGVTFTEGPS